MKKSLCIWTGAIITLALLVSTTVSGSGLTPKRPEKGTASASKEVIAQTPVSPIVSETASAPSKQITLVSSESTSQPPAVLTEASTISVPVVVNEPVVSEPNRWPAKIDFMQNDVPRYALTPCGPINCKPRQSSWDFGGWIEAGMMKNQHGQKDKYEDGVLIPGNTEHLDNAKFASFQMNQLWLYAKKERDDRRFDIGGLLDFNYGVDDLRMSRLDKHWGHGDYCVSLPQMFIEVGTGDFYVSAGKFYTAMGLDSPYAHERFFYTTTYEYHTCVDYGAIFGTWKLNDKLSVFGGWTNGEDRFFTDLRHNNALLWGAAWQITPAFSLDYAASFGRNCSELEDEDRNKYFANTLLARFDLGKWDYAVMWFLRNVDSLDEPGSSGRNGRYGITHELVYTINDRWGLGLGAEWFKHYDNQDETTAGNWDVFAIRTGVNWKPRERLTLRSEVRYDKFDGHRPFKNETKSGQFLYGFSGIMTF